MITLTEKYKCTGCTACVNVCPSKCIKMEKSSDGFFYPSIDEDKCIGCKQCEVVCPIDKSISSENEISAYVVQDKRDEIRSTSSSGGAFTSIAEFAISQNGTVYGAAYDENFSVLHIGVKQENELSKFRGSKYVQSELDTIFTEIKEKLNSNELILFSGTPCQVVGLKSFLKKEYSNLITVDLACHGVPSPKVWDKYLKWWKKKENSNLSVVEFRSKKYGYSGSTMRLVFENGHEYSKGAMLQFHKNAMFSGLSMRESCHKCSFKTINRQSDFTIFDCWDVNRFCKSFDDDKGTTAVLIHSKKGNEIFNIISNNWKYYKVNTDELIKYDGDMITDNAAVSPLRKDFFNDIDQMSLTDVNNKYFPMTIKKRLINIFKPMLYHMGILSKIKRKLK